MEQRESEETRWFENEAFSHEHKFRSYLRGWFPFVHNLTSVGTDRLPKTK